MEDSEIFTHIVYMFYRENDKTICNMTGLRACTPSKVGLYDVHVCIICRSRIYI